MGQLANFVGPQGVHFVYRELIYAPLDFIVYLASTSVVVAQWLIIFSTGDSG